MGSRLASATIYGLLFAGIGVSLPFGALWFESQGLSGAEIAVILAAPMLARAATGPLLAVWADGFVLRRTALAWLSIIAAVAYGACAFVEGFGVWLILWFVAATAAASLIPLSDALVLTLARKDRFTFSIPRGVGSLTFIVANVIMGALLRDGDFDLILVWIVVASAALAIAALVAPATRVMEMKGEGARTTRLAGLGQLVSNADFMSVIFAVGLLQAAHAFYYGFSAIAWQEQGISSRNVGLLWAFSVVVEVALMWLIEPWRRRREISPYVVLLLGAAASVVRWTALAYAPPLELLWPLQALHALSFAAVYLAAMQIIERLASPDQATAAQMLYSSLSAGLLIGMATAISGPLYDVYGVKGYFAMTAIALAGGILIVFKSDSLTSAP